MRKHIVPALITLMLCLPLGLQADVTHLLPKVHSLNVTNQLSFDLQRAVTITDVNNTAALKKVFTDYGCTIQDGASATVTVQMVDKIEGAYDYALEGYDNEGYQLIVETNAITIKAVKPIGVIRAAQTLAQLAEGYEEGAAAIETVEITDWAAFKLRGYMHDVGRSFISVEELKKHIDLLSRFKVNTFHWHFTENQAWRFEVEGYPQLTAESSMTRFEGKYYTQDQCREVAQYAHERGVTIIPEIDMPGHSEAFKRAMGFSMQTDEGVEILKKVLTQVADVFPHSPYIHIGADEEAITYPNFLGIMADHIHGLGRKMVVWNPIRGVGINSTMCDMTQMWSSSGANINGVPDIDCRYNYTNHFDVFADVVGIYKSNIYYADKGSSEIAGTISAYWNDRKTPTEEDIVKQNNMYANVLASAERAWIGSKVNGAEGYIEKLGTTLPNSGEVYEEFKSWEERFLFHKAHSLKNEPIPYVKQTNVRWRITDPFPNGGNSGATFAPDAYATTNSTDLIPETFTHEGKTYYTGMATGAGIYLRHVWGNNIIPTYYGSTNYNNMTSYAWTYVYSPKAQKVGAQIEFQNYGRSEKDSAPDAGKWDRKGSDIWLNGSRINPPTWDNTGKGINNEVDLGNENFTARSPIEVQLNEGWNKVFIKLPYVGAGGVRLNKWMFTFVLTDLEGKNAVEGLIYSPNQCLDEVAETTASKVSELKRNRATYIGKAVGQWPESAAAALDAKIAEVEATLGTTMTAEERAAQVAELDAAWAALTPTLTADKMNMPDPKKFYRMCTPQRDSRYPTAKGAGNDIMGEQTPSDYSVWQFEVRTDGSYDIVNALDGTYISPASNNNTALKTSKDKPSTGWTLKPATTAGLVIVTNGSVQFNQTNSAQGYRLYNWGSGTNTTDTGCQYLVEETDKVERDVEDVIDTDVLESVAINSVDEFENGGVYTFVTKRGWMGATKDNNKAISTAKTQANPVAAPNNKYFQWMVYKSAKGNYYLYNMGKKKFLGVQSDNNTDIDFVSIPAGRKLTFKKSGSAEYPIMFSTDNAGVVNHNANFGGGLINWTGGWDNLNDEGSNHKVTRVKKITEADLKSIADLIEAYDAFLYVTAEVQGLTASTPNTHFGSVKAIGGSNTILTNLKMGTEVSTADYDGTKETTTIAFDRAYRGFEFQGYRVGNTELGESFTLTEEIKAQITEKSPLVAKFATTDEVTLFYDDDPFSYRIPAIGKTSTGRLIAVSDYRHSLDDIGRYNFGTATPGIDLVIRTSDDNGKTWSETKTIAKGSYKRNTDDCAYGDAAIAVVGEKVLVMAAAGDVMFGNGSATAHNRAVRVFSEDNGATWTKQDISETLFLGEDATIKNGYSSFFGSGRLAVDENYNGTGKARIYGALLLKKASGTGNYVIYTDDLGLTWNILGGSQDPVANQDEPKVEILPSGQILLSVRRGGGRQFNVFTYTNKATNAGSWDSNVNGCNNGGSNTCNGEIYCVDAKKQDGTDVKLLLQSQPKGGSGLYDRRDVTIWYKEITDANYTSSEIASNWIQGLQVSTQQSAYSAMTMQANGKIALFFEEAPCYGDDQAKGYCMVYIPLTIEEITNGAYNSTIDTGIERPTNALQDASIYDLQGRKLDRVTEHGIYIVGGKKVVR